MSLQGEEKDKINTYVLLTGCKCSTVLSVSNADTLNTFVPFSPKNTTQAACKLHRLFRTRVQINSNARQAVIMPTLVYGSAASSTTSRAAVA